MRHITLLFIFAIVATWQINAQTNLVKIIASPVPFPDNQLSVAVLVLNDDFSQNYSLSGDFQLNCENGTLSSQILRIRNGASSLSTHLTASSDIILTIDGFTGHREIIMVEKPVKEVDSSLISSTSWSADTIYHVSGGLQIDQGTVLEIEAGTIVMIAEMVNIQVNGQLLVNGTEDKPVIFTAEDPALPWGGIELLPGSDTSVFQHTFFRFGGGNPEYIFGHSDSQPVVLVKQTGVIFECCYFLDNAGKALGSSLALVELSDCIISRCDTGGEYMQTLVNIARSWFIDIPDTVSQVYDDDNDASYFYSVHPQSTGPSKIDHCFFIHGDDDAIDHNSANLLIENCFISDFYHEGIAASGQNSVTVFNTLVKNCDQGIEAGYGDPQVSINHCVLLENNTGLRFGDSYATGCSGHIQAQNSILYNNNDNILNYDNLTQGPVEDAIDITYSMTNDPEYGGSTGCFDGIPQFDQGYMLQPGSPGSGMASNGSDVGLLNPILFSPQAIPVEYETFTITPNPAGDRTAVHFYCPQQTNIWVKIFEFSGALCREQHVKCRSPGKQQIEIAIDELAEGCYIIIVTDHTGLFYSGKLIKTRSL